MRTVVVLALLVISGCVSRPLTQEEIEDVPLKPVAQVDLDRYMGRWYMIANIPYFAERGNVAVHVEYSRRADGSIEDIYTAREGFDGKTFSKKGLIWITDEKTRAAGSITFLPPLWQDFTIVYLDKDYRYTAIAHPSRDFCWIFAREPYMGDEIYKDILATLKDNLFDISRVLKIPHTREQIGALGFQ
jgi:apolipoprotein D and lipocalin family protein